MSDQRFEAAVAAMQALLLHSKDCARPIAMVAEFAVAQADALLAELARTAPQPEAAGVPKDAMEQIILAAAIKDGPGFITIRREYLQAILLKRAALMERLKAAEAVCEAVIDYGNIMYARGRIPKWRDVKAAHEAQGVTHGS